ncbi:MAG TPA: glycosyltransferase family 9 protein [Acidimicrobiales bacterium]|nr:glycosyltransferase family 9 protein [Acidimicrobiales bacterium]
MNADCAFLAPGRRPLVDPATMRIAIVRLRVGLGDLMASVPALRALRHARPDAQVTMITWEEMRPVVDRMAPYVDELLPFPGYVGIPEHPPDPEAWPGFLDAARRRRFDLAVQMYGGQAAANDVTEQLGARLTGGFFTPGAYDADLSTHVPYPHREHEIDRHLALLSFLGAPPQGRHMEWPLSERDHRESRALRRRHSLDAAPYAILHPGATAPSRRWPPERFAAVADALHSRGLRTVVTGVRGEEPLCRAVARHARTDVIDVCGATTIGGFGALVSTAEVVVTNDTGTAQLAVALRVPSVTAFLAGDHLRWAGEDHRHRVVTAGVTCQPCGHQRCPIDHRCASLLHPDTVVAACDAALDGHTSPDAALASGQSVPSTTCT